MSVASPSRPEDKDVVIYNGRKPRPLSIIEENDSDDSDNVFISSGEKGRSTPTNSVKSKIPVVDHPSSSTTTTTSTKITKATAAATSSKMTPATTTATTKSLSKSSGVKKNVPKKKPPNIDISKVKSQAPDSKSKPSSPRTKTVVSSDSKIASKILHFSKNIRMSSKSDSNPKSPPAVASKTKSSSSLPLSPKGKGSSTSLKTSKSGAGVVGRQPSAPPSSSSSSSTLPPSSPSTPTSTPTPTSSPTSFTFPKSPSVCSQTKSSSSKAKTDTPTSPVDSEASHSIKNIVKRTVSRIESHVASVTSPARRTSVKGDHPKRKVSQQENDASAVQQNVASLTSDQTAESVSQNEKSDKDPQSSQDSTDANKNNPEIKIQEISISEDSISPSSSSSPTSSNNNSKEASPSSKTSSPDGVANRSLSGRVLDNERPRSTPLIPGSPTLARLRETAESVVYKPSSTPPTPRAFPSPTTSRVPFTFRQSPKLNHRILDPVSLSFNSSKPLTQTSKTTINLLSIHSQLSHKGDPGTSDSENDESQSQTQSLIGDKSPRVVSAPRSPYLTPKFHGRRGSYFFKRRVSTESLTSLSENESMDATEEITPPASASDFNQLKATTDRLRLSTRRASVMQWRQQYVDSPAGNSRFSFKNGLNGDVTDERLTSERKQKIDEALEWLRTELQDMRSQDQMLARQLLTIRNDIHQLKLRRCTAEHQDMLDDFKSELDELHEFSDVLDIPQPIYEDNPLRHIGVTRLNISARRFSAC